MKEHIGNLKHTLAVSAWLT